jgi:K+-transporting ATPase c subunit
MSYQYGIMQQGIRTFVILRKPEGSNVFENTKESFGSEVLAQNFINREVRLAQYEAAELAASTPAPVETVVASGTDTKPVKAGKK